VAAGSEAPFKSQICALVAGSPAAPGLANQKTESNDKSDDIPPSKSIVDCGCVGQHCGCILLPHLILLPLTT
jgi:hypothetical protein